MHFSKLIILVAIILAPFFVAAQTGSVSGVIKGDDELLPYASIVIKELNRGVKSNGEGNYSLKKFAVRNLSN